MKEIVFRHNILQKDGRVKIPAPVVESLGIREGHPIDIILDTRKECIIIEKARERADATERLFNSENRKAIGPSQKRR